MVVVVVAGVDEVVLEGAVVVEVAGRAPGEHPARTTAAQTHVIAGAAKWRSETARITPILHVGLPGAMSALTGARPSPRR